FPLPGALLFPGNKCVDLAYDRYITRMRSGGNDDRSKLMLPHLVNDRLFGGVPCRVNARSLPAECGSCLLGFLYLLECPAKVFRQFGLALAASSQAARTRAPTCWSIAVTLS